MLSELPDLQERTGWLLCHQASEVGPTGQQELLTAVSSHSLSPDTARPTSPTGPLSPAPPGGTVLALEPLSKKQIREYIEL